MRAHEYCVRPYIQHHISLCTITTIIPQNTQHILVSYRTSTHSTKPERARSCPFCRSPYKLLGGGDTAGAAESDAGVGCLPYEYSVKLINKVGAEMSLSPRASRWNGARYTSCWVTHVIFALWFVSQDALKLNCTVYELNANNIQKKIQHISYWIHNILY